VQAALVRGTPVLTVVASPVLSYLLLCHEGPTLLLVAAAALVTFAVRGLSTASLLLIPVGLVSAAFTGGTFTVLGTSVLVLIVALRMVAGALPIRPAHVWIGLLAALLLASFLAPAITTATPPRADLIGLLTGLGLLTVAVASPAHPRRLARMTGLAGATVAVYVLVCGEHASGRLEGLGLNPNYLGALLALPLVAAAGLLRQERNPAWLAPCGLCLVAIAETQSRGAFLAASLGIAVILIQGRPFKLQAAVVTLLVVVAVTLPGSFRAVEHLASGNRQATELSSNSAVRKDAAAFAAHVAVEHPSRGIGYGMFPSYAARSPHFGVYMATHDDYLRLAAEAGIGALASFLVLLWLAMRGRRSGDEAVLQAIVLTYAVGLFFANLLANLVISMPFWLSLGCLLAGAPNTRQSHRVIARKVQLDDRQSSRDPHRRPIRVRQQLARFRPAG
jgi:O-antigen ligase